MTTLGWEEAKCPVCGLKYSYIKGGYNPSTCNNFDCLYKYLHRTPLKAEEVMQSNKRKTSQ